MAFHLGQVSRPNLRDALYISAHGSGGVDAVNRLIDTEFEDCDARVVELERMEDTGLWRIRWHFSSHDMSRHDFGIVSRYLG